MSKFNKKGNVLRWIFFAIIFVIICAIAFAPLILWLLGLYNRNDDIPVIKLASTDYTVRYGEDGYIFASLLYFDGHTEDGEFDFRVVDENESGVISFNDDAEAGNGAAGYFTASFPSEQKEYSVEVEVYCMNISEVEPAQIEINVIPGNSSGITFKYSRYDENDGEVISVDTAKDDIDITIYDGQALTDVEPEDADDMSPYKFAGWYVVENGNVTDLEFGSDKIFYSDNWGSEIVLQARYVAQVTANYDTYGVSEEKIEVAYGDWSDSLEKLSGNAAELTAEEEQRAGWEFDGWAVDSGEESLDLNDDSVCRLFHGTSEGYITLYSRWTTDVEVDIVFGEGAEHLETFEVTYNASIDYSHEYANGGLLEGIYYSDGSEKKLLKAECDENGVNKVSEPYTLEAGMKFTAEISFAIQFEDMGEDISGDYNLRIIHGESLGSELPSPEEKNGWTFEGWYTDSGEVFDPTALYSEGKPLSLKSKRQTELNVHRELDADGNPTADSSIITLVYGTAPSDAGSDDLTMPQAEGWEFDAYYTLPGGEQGDGEKLLWNTAYTDNGGIDIYAAWYTDIALEYPLKDSLISEAPSELKAWYNGEVDYPEPPQYDASSDIKFLRWYYAKEGKRVQAPSKFTMSADTVLIAEISLAVKLLDWAGTEEIETDLRIVYGESLSYSGNELPVSVDESNGWEFLGWNTSFDGEGEEYGNDTEYSGEKSLVLYAVRTGKLIYHPELDSDGGADSAITETEMIYGVAPDLPESVPEEDAAAGGWTFGGLYTGQGGTGEKFNAALPYTGNGELNLYAKWSGKAVFNLTFADGTFYSSGTPMEDKSSIDVTYGGVIQKLPSVNYKDNNGIFEGWFTEAYGAGTLLENGEVYSVSSLNLYDGVRFTISFNYNDATSGDEEKNISVFYGQSNISLPEPEKEGWDFDGWYSVPNGSEDFLFDGSEQFIGESAGNITLYAVWSRTVEFDYVFDGYDGNITDYIKTRYGEDVTDFAWPGMYGSWTFGGWFTEPYGDFGEGDLYFDTDDLQDAYTKLYAYWFIEDVELVYHNREGNSEYLETLVYGLTVEQSTTKKLPDINNADEIGEPVDGYAYASGWFVFYGGELSRTQITDMTTAYPKYIEGIHLSWNSSTITVRYVDPADEDELLGSFNIDFNSETVISVSEQIMEKDGLFLYGLYLETNDEGYPDNKKFYFICGEYGKINSCIPWDIAEDNVVLYAEWRDQTADYFGNGTAQAPYLLYTADQMYDLAARVNKGEDIGGAHFRMERDIDLESSKGRIWEPIGNNNHDTYYSEDSTAVAQRFSGVFDGNNKTVSGYTVPENNQIYTDTYTGLFGYIAAGGEVKDLNVGEMNIGGYSTREAGSKGGGHYGAIAGVSSGAISNCNVVSGTVSGRAVWDTHVGGIVGYMFLSGSVVKNCTVSKVAEISGEAGRCVSHGGIVGSVNNGVIYGCINNAEIHGTNKLNHSYGNGVHGYTFLGGIAGVCCAVIVDCANYGEVDGGGWTYDSTSNAGSGAIVGYLHNGSDVSTDETGDDSLEINKNGEYYCAIVNCSGDGSHIGFVQNDSGNNKKTIAWTQGTTYKAFAGSAVDIISDGYFNDYLDGLAVDRLFENGSLTVPEAYVMSEQIGEFVPDGGLTEETWQLPADSYAYIILIVSLAVGAVGGVVIAVSLKKTRVKNTDKLKEKRCEKQHKTGR